MVSLLTPQPPVPVRFAGARAAEGPLTFGQLNILRWVGQYAEPPPTAQLTWTLELPDGVGVEDVAAAFAVLLLFGARRVLGRFLGVLIQAVATGARSARTGAGTRRVELG